MGVGLRAAYRLQKSERNEKFFAGFWSFVWIMKDWLRLT